MDKLKLLNNMNTNKPKLIAYYLPQFYEIEFNNNYWGKGYTEWTTTTKAKPLFKGHYQPHIPADLGFYNLLMPEARKAQAEMAQKYGIDGFCYWHYWFGNGKTIMEKPLDGILATGEPDFPFCLCWANHSWHNPSTHECILKQTYPGESDYKAYFDSLLPAFRDKRYIKINGKPLLAIFEPESIPNPNRYIELWQTWAKIEGFPGIYFVGLAQIPETIKKLECIKLDAINAIRLKDFHQHLNPLKERIKYMLGSIHSYKYELAAKYFVAPEDTKENIIPTIIPGWDHSPRAGKNSLILTDYTPDAFREHLEDVFKILEKKENRLCFVKAWNEWGEGNHLEPDLKYGLQFLEVLKETREKYER